MNYLVMTLHQMNTPRTTPPAPYRRNNRYGWTWTAANNHFLLQVRARSLCTKHTAPTPPRPPTGRARAVCFVLMARVSRRRGRKEADLRESYDPLTAAPLPKHLAERPPSQQRLIDAVLASHLSRHSHWAVLPEVLLLLGFDGATRDRPQSVERVLRELGFTA